MSAVQGFVAKYVRELAMDDARRDAMLMSLREGKPFLQEENMTVAIIDVAGYSALASLLEQMLGKLSSEVITSAVGDYMAKIAEVIYRYDGDIVKFLGDALLVTFSSTSPSDTNDSTSLRAIECCLEILKRYPVYEINLDQWSQILKASQTPVDPAIDTHTLSSEHRKMSVDGSVKVSQKLDKRRSLTLHVAVARGSVGRVILGAPRAKELCLTLQSRVKWVLALDLLSLLEVNDISSRAVHDGFEVLGRKEVSRLADGISPGTATRQDSILSRIETAEHAYVVGRSNSVSGSIRRASVFPVHSIPEAAVEFITNILSTVDDKGQSMLACFGLPPFVSDKCGLIAVKAAARFAYSLPLEDLCKVSISVTTAIFFLERLVGTRLLSIDKGVILLDDRTRELVGDTFSVTNLGFMKVKGKAHPLNVWSISNFTAVAVQTDLSVIARGSEVDQLNSFIAVRDIFIQMLQIRGLHTTTRSSSLTISTIATGRTSFVETNVMTLDKSAYESLLRDAKENVGFATLLLAMVKGESFAQQGDEEVTMDRRSMITKRNEGDGSDEAKRRALKFVLVRVISHLCAKYRIAVLLDDAQWIDDSSLEVFFILADKHPELFMTTFTRPIRNLETGNFLHQLLASNFVHHLPLAGISLEDMSSILAQYMKAKSVEVKLLNEIYGQTHGNLLQTESLLRYLMERSDEVVYVDESGQLCGKNSETLKTVISQSVEAVIMSQFDRALAYLAMTKANLKDLSGGLDSALKCFNIAGLIWPNES
ncbi:hypothetical protein BC829DRAFT_441781 [Chytridium lagenaria]|nr:hypothetical protein BC829DRAFT_441781 [Chytridium lagenaria]